jgi:uncharacterized protein YjdB
MRRSKWFALAPALLVAPLFLAPSPALAQKAKAVAEVQVVPAAVTLAVGAERRLTAMAYDADGNVIASGVRYRWLSNNVNVARVDSTGTVRAVAPGTAVVRAVAEGSGKPPKRGVAAVTVRGGGA